MLLPVIARVSGREARNWTLHWLKSIYTCRIRAWALGFNYVRNELGDKARAALLIIQCECFLCLIAQPLFASNRLVRIFHYRAELCEILNKTARLLAGRARYTRSAQWLLSDSLTRFSKTFKRNSQFNFRLETLLFDVIESQRISRFVSLVHFYSAFLHRAKQSRNQNRTRGNWNFSFMAFWTFPFHLKNLPPPPHANLDSAQMQIATRTRRMRN